jgi:hypothetical protein
MLLEFSRRANMVSVKLNDEFYVEKTSEGYVLFNAGKAIFGPFGLKKKSTLTKIVELTGAPVQTVEEAFAEISVYASQETRHKKEESRKQGNVQVTSGQPSQHDIEPVVLEHLTMIENPEIADFPVVVEAVVSSTSISYLVPKSLLVYVTDKDGAEDNRTIPIGEKNPVNIKFCGVNEDIKYKRLKRFVEEIVNEPGSRVRIEEQKWRTIYKIRVRPPVFTLEKREGKIVDEKGYEYKSYDIYVCADKPITFEASSLVRLKGIVLPNPHSQNTTLLVHEVEFPEEFRSFDMERLDKLRNRFNGFTVQQRIDWILSNFEKFSQIIGRTNLAFEGFLAFFTPTYIQLNGKIERGWGNVADVGDTTTGKSETVKKLILLLRAGMLITAETASAVGLVGTATQSEKGQWTVDWGFLVLNDRKLLAIDGAHKLPFSQWAALAESERSGVVTIAKAAKNSAYARTRQIKIANAVDREQDKFCTKSMKDFLYPIQTLSTVFDKTGIARLDLAVFADSRDVKAEDVNRQLDSNYDKDLELLADVLRWCWSNAAKVEFTAEAVKKILSSATDLYQRFFSDSVPLTSIDVKWKLARLSAALAFMTISSEDYKVVTVTEEYVETVVAFIEREYSDSSLNTLAQEDKYEVIAQKDVDVFIANVVYRVGIDRDKVVEILKFIVLQGRVTKDLLKSKFGLADNSQLRPLLAVLESEKLLRGGRGYYPTPKLIEAYKILSPLSPLSTPEKGPLANQIPNNYNQQEIMTPSLSGVVKRDKRDENIVDSTPSQVESIEDELVQKLRQQLSPDRGYSLDRVRSILQQEGLSEQDAELKLLDLERAKIITIDDANTVFLTKREGLNE